MGGLLICFVVLFSTLAFADTVKHVYDDLNRLKRTEYQSGIVVEYTYDEVGNRLQRVVGANIAAPTNLTATITGLGKIVLAWTDTSNNETGFKIERKCGTDTTYTQIATVGANVATYTHTVADTSPQCWYRVMAYNGAGNSAPTNEAVRTYPPVRIARTSPVYYNTFQDAYNAANTGEAIQSRKLDLTQTLVANRAVTITLTGGYDDSYATTTGYTTLRGNMTMSNGKITIKNVVLDK